MFPKKSIDFGPKVPHAVYCTDMVLLPYVLVLVRSRIPMQRGPGCSARAAASGFCEFVFVYGRDQREREALSWNIEKGQGDVAANSSCPTRAGEWTPGVSASR